MTTNKLATTEPTGISWGGKKIVLPEDPKHMTIDAAMTTLAKAKAELEQMVSVKRRYQGYFPLDVAHAFWKVAQEQFGFVFQKTEMGMFGQKILPSMVEFQTGPFTTEQAPFGSIELPGITGKFIIELAGAAEPVLEINAQIQQAFKKSVTQLLDLVEEYLEKKSIYRGRAIGVNLEWVELVRTGQRPFDPVNDAPKFVDTSKTKLADLIFDKDVHDSLDIALFTPISHADAMRSEGIPLKRGILLHGPYGCGKTLTATATAKLCEQNGWTFMYLQNVMNIAEALRYAKKYAPCVVFAEDLDAIVGTDERTAQVNAVLNTIDGMDFKTSEVITILTTNDLEKINPAMLRPGRLDAVVPIMPPKKEAVVRLIRSYAGASLERETSVDHAAEILSGQIPAVIAEAVHRARIAAVQRTKGESEITLSSEDLVRAANSMALQVKSCNRANRDPFTPERLAGVVGLGMANALVRIARTVRENGGNVNISDSDESFVTQSIAAIY